MVANVISFFRIIKYRMQEVTFWDCCGEKSRLTIYALGNSALLLLNLTVAYVSGMSFVCFLARRASFICFAIPTYTKYKKILIKGMLHPAVECEKRKFLGSSLTSSHSIFSPAHVDVCKLLSSLCIHSADHALRL